MTQKLKGDEIMQLRVKNDMSKEKWRPKSLLSLYILMANNFKDVVKTYIDPI